MTSPDRDALIEAAATSPGVRWWCGATGAATEADLERCSIEALEALLAILDRAIERRGAHG